MAYMHARFQSASLGFAGIGAAYADLLVLDGDAVAAIITNGTDTDVAITFDAGTTDFYVPAGTIVKVDFSDIGRMLAKQTIRIKDGHSNPTSGFCDILVIR